MLGIIIVIVVLAIGGFLFYAVSKPDRFQVTRSQLIEAPADRIFTLINDFHQWRLWSPWENLDPDLKREYSGPESGVGAAYAWEGDKRVGTGRMEIVESVPSSRVSIKLDFFKPFEAHNQGEFLLEPQGTSTKVIWTMGGPQPFMSKIIGSICCMDKMVGKQFEKGLNTLKSVTENPK